MATQLDSQKLLATADQMALRVRERFPGSGLAGVAALVAATAPNADAVARSVSEVKVGWRLLGVLVTAVIILIVGVAIYGLRVPMHVSSITDLIQGIEALINIIVFGGIAMYFVFSLETRVKRSAALKLLASLRSLAHVIDMHQLSKDPSRLKDALPQTAHSPPKMQLTPELLTRYLDYCSELLAIISKLAALQVQRFDDPVTLAAVNDLEELVSGLSRKIWQKIMIIDRLA
ncbi:MAG: hypothetical protein H7144_01015 [Burkholderiales bacterium]|nr:hypothetical protein [Phycisphaerae bacterium]